MNTVMKNLNKYSSEQCNIENLIYVVNFIDVLYCSLKTTLSTKHASTLYGPHTALEMQFDRQTKVSKFMSFFHSMDWNLFKLNAGSTTI